MDKNQCKDRNRQPKASKLLAEEVEKIREVFMETGGYINKTARHTGFAKSTVSRYARKENWHEELLCSDPKQPETGDATDKSPFIGKDNRETVLTKDRENRDADRQVMSKLVALRRLLLEEIMRDAKPETVGESPLKILPRTLAEAVKALIDVDKRIAERERDQPATILDAYQNILARCARIVEDKPE